LSSGRSLKVKNTQNRVFLFCGVITKIKGIFWKILEIIIIQGNNYRYDVNMMEYNTINYKVHGYILYVSTSTSLTYARP
jgi:hypothetical protein